MAKGIMNTIGCDLGDRESHFCELDGRGRVVDRQKVLTTRSGLSKIFEKKARSQIVIEIGTHARWSASC